MKELLKCKIFEKFNFYYLEDDKYVGQRIALGKYEPYETELILRQVKKGDVVIDVGANIGYYTILLADKIGPSGKVYAFEPDSKNFEILEKNIEINKLSNVILVKAALSSQKGVKKLYKSAENYGDHRMFGKEKKRENEEVKTVKLDDFLKNKEKKVDFLKIDTQGWEPAVFDGAKEIVEKNKPIIFFEYSPKSYQAAKLDGDRMIYWLENIYKNIFWIDEWLYLYKKLDKKKIDEICKKNKTGYADLWLKDKNDWRDRLRGYKNLKIKKIIKRIIKYN